MTMKHEYKLTGMTCTSCEEKVRTALQKIPEIQNVELSHKKDSAKITMSSHLPLSALQDALQPLGDKYEITGTESVEHKGSEADDHSRSWLETYKPILLIFFYLLGVSLLVQWYRGEFQLMNWMHHFMAGFFLVFSFFKMLNLKGFVSSYRMYDVIAKQFPAWGYVYAFTELALGVAFLIHFAPLITYSVTFVVMTVSIIGVLKAVLDKKRIQCACLGDVFKLPMSTVTIIEDGLMIAMSAFMIFQVL